MKTKIILAALLIGILFSCKKKNEEIVVAPFTLSGTTFKGTYTNTVDAEVLPISIKFNADSTINLTRNTLIGPGKWSKGTSSNLIFINFESTIAGALRKYKGNGTINTDNNKIEGTYIEIINPAVVYTFTTSKQ
jgi:hypothetical protein